MIAQDMVAVRLTPPFQAIMVATPSYLAANPPLISVRDLARHNCIGFRLVSSQGIYAWELLIFRADRFTYRSCARSWTLQKMCFTRRPTILRYGKDEDLMILNPGCVKFR
jgi:DNA-binding transcriptional LysR family regulator